LICLGINPPELGTYIICVVYFEEEEGPKDMFQRILIIAIIFEKLEDNEKSFF